MTATQTRLDALYSALLAAGDGQFTRGAALARGMDDETLGRLVKDGALHKIRRGRYVSGEAWRSADPLERHLMLAGAVLAAVSDDSYLIGASALVAHGVELHEPDLSAVRVVRVRGSARSEAGVRHSDGELPVEYRGTARGLRTAGVAWSLVDYARSVPTGSAVAAMDSALRRKLVTRDELTTAAERCRLWSGSRPLMRAVGLCDGRAESVGESLNRVLFVDLDLAPDELQLVISTDLGHFRVDFAWRAHGVLAEFDGRVKYLKPLRGERSAADVAWNERQRELALERAGWVVIRFSWADLQQPELVRRRVLEAFERAALRRLSPAFAH